LAANCGIAFEALLARNERLRKAMRLKAIPCEVKVRINDRERRWRGGSPKKSEAQDLPSRLIMPAALRSVFSS